MLFYPLVSPSKDFGHRVSDQLTALRTLLETRLIDQDEIKRPKKEPSVLQTSPGTFARQFLQSFRQSSYAAEFLSGDDDVDREVERTFPSNQHTDKGKLPEGDLFSISTTTSTNQQRHYEPRIPPSLSSLSDELNPARVSSSATPTPTATIGSNLAAKIDTRKGPFFSPNSPLTAVRFIEEPRHEVHQTADNQHLGSDTERTSSEPSSAYHSPPPPFDVGTRPNHAHDRLFDNEKENSLFPGASFDALLNSLKSMRETDRDFLVRNSEEKLIPVAD